MTHRLFFAIWPDVATRTRLEALVARLRPHYAARWIHPDRYHLTVCFLGASDHVREALAARVMAAVDSVDAEAFVWWPDRVGGFHASRPPCVLRSADVCPPLQGLHAALRKALVDADFALPDARPYAPHVTLGYGRGGAIDECDCAPLQFPVRSFVLLHSISGERAYRELGRWPLAPG